MIEDPSSFAWWCLLIAASRDIRSWVHLGGASIAGATIIGDGIDEPSPGDVEAPGSKPGVLFGSERTTVAGSVVSCASIARSRSPGPRRWRPAGKLMHRER
jgi:hypothetical protein